MELPEPVLSKLQSLKNSGDDNFLKTSATIIENKVALSIKTDRNVRRRGMERCVLVNDQERKRVSI